MIYASSYSYHPDRIEFSETEEKEKNTTNYILEKIDDNKTNLTVDFYMQKNIAKQIIFNVARKKKIEENFRRSLQNLEGLVKEIKLPAACHTQIYLAGALKSSFEYMDLLNK
ncbi:MAG: hypothetical protein ACR2KX_21315 [Chitinophagaceae bacterium]